MAMTAGISCSPVSLCCRTATQAPDGPNHRGRRRRCCCQVSVKERVGLKIRPFSSLRRLSLFRIDRWKEARDKRSSAAATSLSVPSNQPHFLPLWKFRLVGWILDRGRESIKLILPDPALLSVRISGSQLLLGFVVNEFNQHVINE